MIKFGNRRSLARRTLLLAVAVVSCSAFCALAIAQAPGGETRQRGGGVDRELGKLTQALSLTPDQQTQVKALLEQRRGKMEALREGGAQPTREQMEGTRKDTDAKINELLNDDQKTKFAAWQQQRMQRRGPGGDNGQPPPQPPGE